MNSTNNSILVVDDAKVLRKIYSEMLVSLGADVYSASDGREAYEMIRRNRYSAILSDLHMPVMDGMSLYIELKNEGLSIPFVLMSSNMGLDMRSMALASGIDFVMTKPIFRDDLLMNFRHILVKKDFLDA
jgi:CheY-like chemotaxis protein